MESITTTITVGAATILYPLIDSIAELRVFNMGTDAQFGRSLGGVVDVVLSPVASSFMEAHLNTHATPYLTQDSSHLPTHRICSLCINSVVVLVVRCSSPMSTVQTTTRHSSSAISKVCVETKHLSTSVLCRFLRS